MRKNTPLFFLLFFILLNSSILSHAQAWSGILAAGTAVDWSSAGIPGGIPSGSWTQSGSTILASQSPCDNGSGDCTSTIQSALNSCGTNHYVLLGTGTFLLNGGLSIPSNCVLRGGGADVTILNEKVTSGNDISLGSYSSFPTWSSAVSITGGTSLGSTSIKVASATGITVGGFLVIDQVNDGVIVSVDGSEGACTWCDGGQSSDGRYAQGQIVRVTSVSGTTIGITPGLFVAYTNGPVATPITMQATNAGVENLQIYADNTHTGSSSPSTIEIGYCYQCWVSGIQSNYTDGDHIDMDWSYQSEIINSNFSGTYGTGPGACDHGIRVANKSTFNLIQNNIMDRTGVLEQEWGAAGNVFGYNYMTGAYSTTAPNFMSANIEAHGAHPMLNLFEGNVVNRLDYDSIHGSSAYNTTFRNWLRGAAKACNPLTGTRGTVVCTPMGVQGKSGINGWWEIQAVRTYEIDFLSTYNNLVGDVIGSSEMAALCQYDNCAYPMGQQAVIGAPSALTYDETAFGIVYGYGEASDPGGVKIANGVGCDGPYAWPCESTTPQSTAFLHGVYNNVNASITWANGVTHTLPPSFYLSAQPSWWTSSIPWPAIGPDVSGGAGPGGHVSSLTASNPAQNCYQNVMGGSEGGAGSPLKFNASNCYSASQILPPTQLKAKVH